MGTDFYGLDIDLADRELVDRLVFIPLQDSLRTMHSLSCPHHDFEIDEDGSINLLAEEVRAIAFIVPHWLSMVEDLVTVDEELQGVFDAMTQPAVENQDHRISISDARMLYACIPALNTIVNLRYTAFLNGLYGEENED